MDEKTMQAYASYAVGEFVATIMKSEGSIDQAEIAHALFLLREEADKRRKEWLGE